MILPIDAPADRLPVPIVAALPTVPLHPRHPRRTGPASLRRLLSGTLLALPLMALPPVAAQEQGYGQTLGPGEGQSDVFNDGPGRGDSILDATNPIDLMNRLRRATALDEATSPSSAIDAALRDYEEQAVPGTSPASASPRPGPSRLIQAP